MNNYNRQSADSISIIGLLKGLLQIILIYNIGLYNIFIGLVVYVAFATIHFYILKESKDNKNSGSFYFFMYSSLLFITLIGGYVDYIGA